MIKYLYGAAVQGIQDFIFKTNELRHIVGASELVETVCTSAFDEFYGSNGEAGVIVKAAGNIKFLFDNESDCRRAVKEFPRKVMNMAPGITISQAVYPLTDDNETSFGKAIDAIEMMLKTQRNKPTASVTVGLMGMKRANNTGSPVTYISKGNYYDDATVAKLRKDNVRELCKKSFGVSDIPSKQIAFDVDKLTKKNDWIAVIHADGNGLGKVVQKVGKDKERFKEFSHQLSEATVEAAHRAFAAIEDKIDSEVIPIRPVVLSGDDMTVIIRGDLAIPYVEAFMRAFEETTKKRLGSFLKDFHVFTNDADHLTSCAGVAFIKSSFPFYYGYDLAEQLCSSAKKHTKSFGVADEHYLPESCLLFHKVQDSFIRSYDEIVERELTASDNFSFQAGPYYINDKTCCGYTLKALLDDVESLDNESENGLKTGVKQWITLRLVDKHKAAQRRDRMKEWFSGDDAKIVERLTAENRNACVAYDVLAYHTIINQVTK